MKANEFLAHFLDQAYWVDKDKTVDRIIHGDGEKEVKNILVVWQNDMDAIEEAARIGADTIMTHEPTFYNHMYEVDRMREWGESHHQLAMARKKIELMDKYGLTVVRNHDVWDRFPDIGIPQAWGRYLGLPDQWADNWERVQYRYDIPPTTLKAFARIVAAKAAELGEPHIQYFGPDDAVVSKVGVGMGCGCSIERFVRLGCDLSIVCDDASCYWKDISWAREAGHSVIRVAHPTSEEAGMITLARYINEQLGISATYFRPEGRYKYI